MVFQRIQLRVEAAAVAELDRQLSEHDIAQRIAKSEIIEREHIRLVDDRARRSGRPHADDLDEFLRIDRQYPPIRAKICIRYLFHIRFLFSQRLLR